MLRSKMEIKKYGLNLVRIRKVRVYFAMKYNLKFTRSESDDIYKLVVVDGEGHSSWRSDPPRSMVKMAHKLALKVVLLVSILGLEHQIGAAADEILPVNECPCVGVTCKDFENCVCLQSRTPTACTCSCPEQMLGIPERPLPRINCACKGFTCAQGQNCLCTAAQLWPPIKCSCSCLKRGQPPPPRVECGCGGYSCNRGEKCDCSLTKPKGTCKCTCYPEKNPPRVNCAQCKGYSCSAGETCDCAHGQIEPLDPTAAFTKDSCRCKCTKKPKSKACPCPGFGCRLGEDCRCGESLDATGAQTCFCECIPLATHD